MSKRDNLYLVGLMGAGKTTVGRLLASLERLRDMAAMGVIDRLYVHSRSHSRGAAKEHL